jgi:hypothetical protein
MSAKRPSGSTTAGHSSSVIELFQLVLNCCTVCVWQLAVGRTSAGSIICFAFGGSLHIQQFQSSYESLIDEQKRETPVKGKNPCYKADCSVVWSVVSPIVYGNAANGVRIPSKEAFSRNSHSNKSNPPFSAAPVRRSEM